MGLDYALDQLLATGWSPGMGASSGACGRLSDGRAYPNPAMVESAFAEAGYVLRLEPVRLFDCYRAEWGVAGSEGRVEPKGSVVGHSREEAAVFALSRMRRSLVAEAV